jgi:diguanylate cyclase (GGDEF)-like protein
VGSETKHVEMVPRTVRLLCGLAVCLALVGLPSPARALAPDRSTGQYVLRSWRAGDRQLPSNVVQAVLQTSDGYLWLGTENGLVRFDGVRFATFDTENTEGLRHNTIQSLCEADDGTLWIGTWGGGLSRYAEGRFASFLAADGLGNDFVRSLAAAPDGALWIGTFGGGVVRRDRDGTFTRFGKEQGLPDLEVRTVFVDRSGGLWVGTRSGGVARFEGARFRVYDKETGLPGNYVAAIHEDRQGAMWFGTLGGGLARLAGERLTLFGTQDGLPSDQVSVVFEDREGNLWVGTRGGGLARRRGERFVTFSTADGLTNDHIRSVHEDREGNLWVGTYGGLNRFSNGTAVTYTTSEGLSNDMVWPILEDRSGDVWMGTWAGLNRFHDAGFQSFRTQDGLPSESIFALAEGNDGTLWIGTFGGGVAGYREGRFFTLPESHGLAGETVWAILPEDNGDLWVGTNGGGLVRVREGRVERYRTGDGLANDIVSCLHRDSRGDLWIGSRTGGVTRLREGRFEVIDSESGLPNDEVRCIHEDDRGVVWIGTRGGLARVKDGAFAAIGMRHGLPGRIAYWILEDHLGYMWVSSGRGIYRVLREELDAVAEGRTEQVRAELFGEADGMKSAECNGGSQPAGWRSSDGRLWFPSGSGAVVIDPSSTYKNATPPPVYVEKVVVDGRTIHPWQLPEGPLVLGPGVDRIEFHYVGLSFTAPERNEYRYMLEGFDESWLHSGARRTAYYTSLAPGRYLFRVVASNNDGVWNEEGASLAFEVKPFFHQTFPFYGLFALGFFLLGAGILYLRMRRLRRRQELLERLVAERTAELADANRRLEKAYARLQETNEMLEDTNLQLEELATSDGLTGLANRRLFDDFLDQEWRRHQRHGRPLSLLLLDVDFFKRYNDTYGHPAGDECLRKVGTALRSAVQRTEDIVARYGGEEFAAVLPETDAAGARALAERIRTSVAELAIPHSSSDTAAHVTVSLGVATTVPPRDGALDGLVQTADKALYEAKERGRNRVVSRNYLSDG